MKFIKNLRYPFFVPITGKLEQKYLTNVIASNYLNEGNYTRLFESKIKKKLRVKYVIATTSGTAAIYLSLKALGIKNEDEVIVPDLTFAATANAVNLCNAKSVLVDANLNDLNIDVNLINKSITKKTKAIIPVHIAGRASNMSEISKICREKNIYIIEDAAEAFMSKHKGKYLGTFGQTGCFSMTPSKIITSGQGGFIVTNNYLLYKKIKKLKNQGIEGNSNGGNVKHLSFGYNFKMTNLQSAVALAQLKTIGQRIKKTKHIYSTYMRELRNISAVKIMPFNVKDGAVPLWTNAYCKKKDKLFNFLKNNRVECRKFWYPLHTQNPYKTKKKYVNATKIYNHSLWLPSSLTLRTKDIIYICKLIKKFFR